MNERIKELADQAEAYADGIVDQGGEFHEAYTQRLAELIVRECADVAWHYAIDWCPEGESPDYGYARVIKQHFGVEE